MTKIITIANRKGGAGKSTCAAHFALEATKNEHKVIILDLDPQKSLESWWQKREDENPQLADAEVQQLKEKLNQINTLKFDFCIIDTPGDTSQNAIEAIKLADIVIIPCKATATDLKAIGRTISYVQDNNKKYIFVLTQTINRAKATQQAFSALSEFGMIAPSVISNRASYANAMGEGMSATSFDKQAAQEIKEVWDFITGKLDINTEGRNGKTKI